MSVNIEIKWITEPEAIEFLKAWGYSHFIGLEKAGRAGIGIDDGVTTRLLIVRFEPDDTIRFIVYAENNPTSDLVDALEAAREFYGHTPKNLYAVCNQNEGNAAIDYLLENHPDAVGNTEVRNVPSGDRKVGFRKASK